MRAVSASRARLTELDEITAESMSAAPRSEAAGLPITALGVSGRAALESDNASK
jgi:hypothetical protein